MAAKSDGDEGDVGLVEAMADGDVAALQTLYDRHSRRLFAYLLGQLGDRTQAEEVLQDVMLAAWSAAPTFRRESRVTTWLIGIARYKALNARRDRRPQNADALPLDAIPDIASLAPDHLESLHNAEMLKAALNSLPDHQRETLELVFYHHLTGDETAAVMGVAPGTVKSRLHRALAALRAWISQRENEHA